MFTYATSDLIEDAVNQFNNGNFDFIIIRAVDAHFRAIVKEQGGNYFLLDSFNRGPTRINAQDVEN